MYNRAPGERAARKLDEELAKISSEISKMEGKIDPIKAMVEELEKGDGH